MADEENTTTWRKVSCQERDKVYAAGVDSWCPGSSLTDLDGQYGDPEIFTEWWDKATERPMLRDRRYPSSEDGHGDLRPCEHYLSEMSG